MRFISGNYRPIKRRTDKETDTHIQAKRQIQMHTHTQTDKWKYNITYYNMVIVT